MKKERGRKSMWEGREEKKEKELMKQERREAERGEERYRHKIGRRTETEGGGAENWISAEIKRMEGK